MLEEVASQVAKYICQGNMNTSGFQQSEYFRFSQGLDSLQIGVMVELRFPPPPRVVGRGDDLPPNIVPALE
jgi:hypothetical protein